MRNLYVHVVTDASKYAWGAHLSTHTSPIFHKVIAQGQCRAQGPNIELCRGTFEGVYTDLGSTVREFEAVIAALKTTSLHLKGSCVRIFSDNTGVVQIIKNNYS